MVHVFGLSYAEIEVLFTDTEGALKTDRILSCLLKFRGVSESAALRLAKLWNFAEYKALRCPQSLILKRSSSYCAAPDRTVLLVGADTNSHWGALDLPKSVFFGL